MTKLSSRFRFLIRNKTFIKVCCNHFRLKKLRDDNQKDTNIIGRILMKYKYDCTKPVTFNEHLSWLKFNYRNKMWEKCADKLEAKNFLIENGFDKYVVKTYKIYNNSSEIKLDELPNQFVLKTNNDCGSIFVCEKGKTNFERVFRSLDNALKSDYSKFHGEWVYENIKPKIYAEELLESYDGRKLVDYKLFGFNGRFGWGFAAINRESDTRFTIFEKDYTIQDVDYIYLRPKKGCVPPKPIHYNEMEQITEKISKILKFVRVDFYETKDGVKIGELTFFSQSGLGSFTKKCYDYKYGEYFKDLKTLL